MALWLGECHSIFDKFIERLEEIPSAFFMVY
jgi:hypothetical protein